MPWLPLFDAIEPSSSTNMDWACLHPRLDWAAPAWHMVTSLTLEHLYQTSPVSCTPQNMFSMCPFPRTLFLRKKKKRRQGIRSDSVHGASFTLCFPAGSWVTRSLYCTDSHQPWEGHWAPSSHCQNMKMLICYFCGLGSYEKKGTNFNFKNGGVMSMCPLKLGSPWSVNFWTLLGFGFLWCKGRLLWWVVQFLGI